MAFITDLLNYEFLRDALIANVLIAFVTGMVSPVIVYKRLEFIGDGLAHAIFAGVAFAVIFNFNILLGSVLATLLFAYLVYVLSNDTQIAESTAIGMLLPVFMSLGVILFSKSERYTTDVTSYLFGNILLISKHDIYFIAAVLVFSILILLWKHYEISYWLADETMAKFYGIKTNIVRFIVLVLVSTVVVAALKLAGVIVMGAFLVLPGAFSKNYAKSLTSAILRSVVFNFMLSLLGFVTAYYFDLPPGPTIVLFLFTAFLISTLFVKSKNGQ
ncbi:zinc transport system permease protein [Fervidobacterium changbaicum]|uniref:Metal ABC transporter permease n=1 Tax=Fervidobacterium changbaicum TaxID=310769 RepID=A0ABX5QQZ9_9BACT|nr:metal ABC transporter permease [Fervidobacterium changbaicum]QAV32890.1 metal ABC transporter permease [Fervidobacterium changbaicum]SDH74924.1 zinc transport system permease protein [Fervidobacterium changbaicum]